MSIRITAVYIFVGFFSIYAWKDWFKSLCGLILLMAVLEHGDMPSKMFGVQGLNPWNFLFIMIFLAWIFSRRQEGLQWDMPNHMNLLLLLYLGVILLGVLRAALDRGHFQWYPLSYLISEELINTIKWVLPGILLFDGCRTRNRVILVITCLLTMYFLIAVQVVMKMPLEAAVTDSEIINFSRKKLDRRIGFNACDLSAMLAGVTWGILASLSLVRKKRYWPVFFSAMGIVALGQALTGGRAGYVAWGATGLTLCFLKWRKYLILAPVLVIILPMIFPGAANRMLAGFGQTDVAGEAAVDEDSLTSGRLVAWPLVIAKIAKSPIIGYGRLAMRRTGLTNQLMLELNDPFPHPHNVYLEALLDNGVLGSLPIFLFWGITLVYSARLFRNANHLYSAVGGLSLALILAQLFAGIGAQHYFPKEGTFGLWTTTFLALRVYVEERRMQIYAIEESWNNHAAIEQPIVAISSYG